MNYKLYAVSPAYNYLVRCNLTGVEYTLLIKMFPWNINLICFFNDCTPIKKLNFTAELVTHGVSISWKI